MIKYCKDCKYSKIVQEPYDLLKCFNPVVNKQDGWTLASIKGSSYGSTCSAQRNTYSYFWNNRCGIQGKQWELKVE